MCRTPSREEMTEVLISRQGKEMTERCARAAVAVCGLGGLGSNIAVALARAGVGKLILIDFDRVDVSNLHRQQYKACQVGMPKPQALAQNLEEISPGIRLELHETAVTAENLVGLLSSADIVCEAFDDPEAKAMLVNGVLEQLPEKYLVAASGMAGFASANDIRTRRVMGRFYLCGDGVSDVKDDIGLVSSRVMVCAAHEAHMVLRILAGKTEA